METDKKFAELKQLFVKLAKSSAQQTAPVYELLAKLAESLRKPIAAILETIPQLQQKSDPENQQQAINTIYQAATTMRSLIKDLQSLSKDANLPQSEINVDLDAIEQKELLKALTDVNTLILCDDEDLRKKIIKQLHSLDLKLAYSTIDEGLQTLYSAQNTGATFQIALVCAPHYDHHIAYLGRTIKSNLHLSTAMTCLALPSELLTFEKEQAHFDGFACLLNMSKPERMMRKLATSWRSWSTKISFDHAKPTETKNRVLLVEDDPIPQKVTQWQLSEMGYEIDTAPDGHTALKLLEQKVYDLIFMDIGLPDISGLEVTAEIRKREDGKRHTPIIGLTIYALESDQKTGLQAGMDEYLVKPVMPDRLKNVLQRWVKNKNINH